MKSLIAAIAVSFLALSGAAAEAAKKPAKVYAATISPTSGSAYGAISGKAQMVDNAKRDNASIQLKGLLNPGSTYSWTIFRAVGSAPVCDPASAGSTVSAFKYKDLKVNPAGNASSTAKSKTFKAVSTTRYGVSVSDADGVVVACGELKKKKAPKKKG